MKVLEKARQWVRWMLVAFTTLDIDDGFDGARTR